MVFKKKIMRFIFLLLATSSSFSAFSESLNIACASDFVSTLKKVIGLYNTTHKVKIAITQGSSGELSTQIMNGFPADIFFSADKNHVQYLMNQKKVKNTFLYATGEVILIAKSQAQYDSAQHFLMHANNLRISIANPQLAPYGAHSITLINSMGLWHKFSNVIIYGENIGVTFNYFITGNVNAAFIARSQFVQYEKTYPVLSKQIHTYTFNNAASDIPQYGAILADSKQTTMAANFVNFLLHSKKAQRVIHGMGYTAIDLSEHHACQAKKIST